MESDDKAKQRKHQDEEEKVLKIELNRLKRLDHEESIKRIERIKEFERKLFEHKLV